MAEWANPKVILEGNEANHQRIGQGELVPYKYDENLLWAVKTKWQFGDWANLASIGMNSIYGHPQRGVIAMFIMAAQLQVGNKTKASEFLEMAIEWGVDKKYLIKILISGVYNSLGRASILGDGEQTLKKYFINSLEVMNLEGDNDLYIKARMDSQLSQLKPNGYVSLDQAKGKSEFIDVENNVDKLIEFALGSNPQNAALLIAHAEAAMAEENYEGAIRRWQHMASVLGEGMFSPYYDRLHQAYLSIKGFPLASPEEETLKGDLDKHELLEKIHKSLAPRLYLEIGVQGGKSLKLAKGNAIGIDPMPQVKFPDNDPIKIFKSTSDQFFSKEASKALQQRPDLVFIDGMHLFEYALRDFINVEKYANANTIVVVDDIFPAHPNQALRERCTRAWTGDVWKLKSILEKYRPDLFIQGLDAYPTGLMMITDLNPNSSILTDNYDAIVGEYIDITTVPDEVLSRMGAWSATEGHIYSVLEVILGTKNQVTPKNMSLSSILKSL
jgi:hypothetical protein